MLALSTAIWALSSDKGFWLLFASCLVRNCIPLHPGITRHLSGQAYLGGCPAKYFGTLHRGFATGALDETSGQLSEKDYHRIADLTLGELMSSLESLIDGIPDISDPDLEYSQVCSLSILPCPISALMTFLC